ncbi:asparagine synthase-related protein [Desulfonatronospira sp.]|uniref:asparagine synthase-related protein n=1 Tax=Desulfonatronospira sp. TaxID=1962951 RepID=UPI0025BD0EDB|nr:asparagine synthase-related protein [Desulfonatronospira sp.]
MSGILGIFNISGEPAAMEDLQRMAVPLERRGPDGTRLWQNGQTGLGHTLLATTPESLHEHLPLVHDASGCVITADARLDNRDDLLARLSLTENNPGRIGDARIILQAYLAWGEDCVKRFLGDYAFAVWNPAEKTLFCGRDHFGMRPLYYHYSPGRFLAFASEPKAILKLPQVPYRINEGRIADYLVSQLEGLDRTSTFFEDVFRSPPANTMTVTPHGMRHRRYWTLEPGPELRLSSDEAYAEAFLDVFTKAVSCRLRGAGPVGAMLSGGMDSGSVVAVARKILADQGRGPLPTVSAVGPNPETCVETRTIYAALTMDNLDPYIINYDQLDDLMPELAELTWNLDEPFDNHMTLLRAIYLAAHRKGIRVMLDGVGGDIVLSHGSHIARLLRAGHWLTAWREAVGLSGFWGGHYPAWRRMYQGAKSAFAPELIRRLHRGFLKHRVQQRKLRENIRASLISPSFARRVALGERLQTMNGGKPEGLRESYGRERARAIDHNFLIVGRERYDRTASALAVEPRDPFLDLRVVDFCLTMPGSQILSKGWPKAVLRRAMEGLLPEPVRWRRGKEHLGWQYTAALMAYMKEGMRIDIEAKWNIMQPYLDSDTLSSAWNDYFDKSDSARAERVNEAVHLSAWLHSQAWR